MRHSQTSSLADKYIRQSLGVRCLTHAYLSVSVATSSNLGQSAAGFFGLAIG